MASALNPTREEPLFIDIRPAEPRCLAAARVFCTVDVAENSTPSGIRLTVAPANAPLFGARPPNTQEGHPQSPLPVNGSEFRAAPELVKRLPNGSVQLAFTRRVRPCSAPSTSCQFDAFIATAESPLIPSSVCFTLRHRPHVEAILNLLHRSVPLHPSPRREPRIELACLLKRHYPRTFVHRSPSTHLTYHPNARVEELGCWFNAEASALFRFEECRRLQRSEMRTIRV